jgi:hypothetical protein
MQAPPSAIDDPNASPLGDDACTCTGGAIYTGAVIPPADTYCNMFVCGKDFITYKCGAASPQHPSGWESFASLPCSSLACPGTGVFCGDEVLNGVPSSMYTCPGAGQVPTEWVVCPGTCKDTGAGTAECGPPPGVCPCGSLGDGYSSQTCGEQHCTPTGQGDRTTMMICTPSGWQDLGQNLDAQCKPAQKNDCVACKGMQDKYGNEIVTTECGRTVCGVGAGNAALFACTPSGWVDVGAPCPEPKPGDPPPLGKCPAQFRDQQQNLRPVEHLQTFCGGQALYDEDGKKTVDIGGDPNSLYACEASGAEPRLVKACPYDDIGGVTVPTCKPVSKLKAYFQGEEGEEKLIKDWDRCLEPCPAWTDAFQYKTGKKCYPETDQYDCTRHFTCGQNPISGRPGTSYACIADDCDKQSASCDYRLPIPIEDCTLKGAAYTCNARENLFEDYPLCVANANKHLWGAPPPTVSGTERCSDIKTYQGLVLPSKDASPGKSVCGIGMQIYRCEPRTLGRPDGWVSTGEPCGTDCEECGPNAYGEPSVSCALQCLDLDSDCPLREVCDETTKNPAKIPCRNPKPGATRPSALEPGYCGDNPALGAKGDSRLLYFCKAQCPDTSLVGFHACEGKSDPTWAARAYVYSKAAYCPNGCRITDAKTPSDECIVLPGLGFGDALDNMRVIQNLGHHNPMDGLYLEGTHLGEDVGVASGNTTGAAVRTIGPGTILYTGENASSYHATVLIAHYVKDPGMAAPVRYCSFYGHLNRESVGLRKAGDKVQQGDVIGTIESWAAIELAHPKLGTSDGDDNSHLHYLIVDDELCTKLAGGGGPCGYDGEADDLWGIGYNDDATAKVSIVAGAPNYGCGFTQGKTLYSPRMFAQEHAQAQVCASLDDCK